MLYPFSLNSLVQCFIIVIFYLADEVTYIWVRCIRYYKINHDPRALLSLIADFFSYRLFSRFFRLAAPEVAQLELSGQDRHVLP